MRSYTRDADSDWRAGWIDLSEMEDVATRDSGRERVLRSRFERKRDDKVGVDGRVLEKARSVLKAGETSDQVPIIIEAKVIGRIEANRPICDIHKRLPCPID